MTHIAGEPNGNDIRTDGPARSGRLVVVSNRVPVPSSAGSTSAGGLAVALDAALKLRGGLWYGWSGKTVEAATDELQVHEFGPVSYAVADLTRRDLDEYYLGFSNRTLWPICHYRLDLAGFSRRTKDGYFRVNELFARQLAPLLKSDDLVWVHDYHFIPFGTYLREMGLANRMGFFLHIPWPPSDIASALPAFEMILRGLCAYDVVGFQTPLDVENFVGCLVREKVGRRVGPCHVEAFGRRLRVQAFPIGIETEEFRDAARDAERNALVRRMRASLSGKKLIIGVDRLDYSKGIGERMESFSCMLERHPHTRGRVTLLQITPKSRSEVPEYSKMQHQVAEQAGWTNGKYGDIDWTPIRYVNKSFSRSALAGLYRLAGVGLVTPLRDGMNLVAKEYVAAQNPADPGVLVLSRFAGAAAELDSALLVNPYDTEGTADAIARALDMPLEERKERWRAQMGVLEGNGIEHWSASFVAALADDGEAAGALSPRLNAGPERLESTPSAEHFARGVWSGLSVTKN